MSFACWAGAAAPTRAVVGLAGSDAAGNHPGHPRPKLRLLDAEVRFTSAFSAAASQRPWRSNVAKSSRYFVP